MCYYLVIHIQTLLTSITAVLFPFVTYLLTLPRNNFDSGVDSHYVVRNPQIRHLRINDNLAEILIRFLCITSQDRYRCTSLLGHFCGELSKTALAYGGADDRSGSFRALIHGEQGPLLL
jgi:hypothetical protein